LSDEQPEKQDADKVQLPVPSSDEMMLHGFDQPVTPEKQVAVIKDCSIVNPGETQNIDDPTCETTSEPKKRPKSAFFLYLEATREDIASSLGVSGMSGAREIARHAGQLWRSLSEEARAPFVKQASELKAKYDAAVQAFIDQGGVRTRKRRRVTAGAAEGEDLGAATQTPQKTRRPRERIYQQGGIHVVKGISKQNATINDGVRLQLKPGSKRRNEPNPVAVYDCSLGCHVGHLSASLAAVVAPLLGRHSAGLRISGHIPPPPSSEKKDAFIRPPLGPRDVHVALVLSGPVEIKDEVMEAGRRLRECTANESSERLQSD
jgi:hypothetical protein